jgi:DNA polymerase III sliding clamp (beta) subunit (PCNA family)
MDHHRTILLDLELESDNFAVYKFKKDEKMYLGINLSHFHKMLKSIKKRDSIQLFIDDNSPKDLGIKVIPKENNRVTTSFIKIQTIQNIDIDLPGDYGKPVIVPSGEFQKMCKGLTHMSNVTKITSKGFMITFSSDAGGVMKRSTEFGEREESESDSEDEKDEHHEYDELFETDQLTRITKLAGLAAAMQIYPKTGDPLMFRSHVGSLGKISIYIKSKRLQESDAHAVESDDEDY